MNVDIAMFVCMPILFKNEVVTKRLAGDNEADAGSDADTDVGGDCEKEDEAGAGDDIGFDISQRISMSMRNRFC